MVHPEVIFVFSSVSFTKEGPTYTFSICAVLHSLSPRWLPSHATVLEAALREK